MPVTCTSDFSLLPRKFVSWIICATLFITVLPNPLAAGTKLSLILTSNLQGRFAPAIENQDGLDPMLLLAQSILHERNTSPFDLYLDLGNSFYPGPVSRFSYGSVMMDFFSYFNCSATLVSSRDISIGLTNLEFLSKGRETKLLSANISREKNPVFTPYLVVSRSGKKTAFIGITSSDGLFDIADQKVLNISFTDYRDAIKTTVEKLRSEGCGNLILLSGLSYRNNLELMQDIPEVNLIISGGDSSGSLFSVPASRVDLQWGRSIVTLLQNDGYYRLDLNLDEGIAVTSMNFTKASAQKISDPSYAGFSKRLTLWKEKFAIEESRLIAADIPPAAVTDETAANMLRHRYRCEIGILEKYSVIPQAIYGQVLSSTVMGMVNNDYPIFTYRLSGSDLKKIRDNSTDLVITGIDDGRVQDYPLADSRRYSICSTQSAYDRISRILRKHVEYTNRWKTLQDEIEADLKSEKSLTSDSFDYLDRRFRVLVDISLSNFYDRSNVERDENIDTPPGKPATTYRRWGMEDTINVTIYNRYHQLVLTPYLYFIKQDDQYLQNLLRGTLLYSYNLNRYLKPYHKSQLDTVLVDVDGRPMLARETVGASLTTERITGKFGAGFEKQIQDPENPNLYGFETIVDASIPFTDEFSYIFKLDSFISSRIRTSDKLKARTEITNTLAYKINSLLGVSLKYKWFYLYTNEINESYKYSQTLISLDIKTDFKFF